MKQQQNKKGLRRRLSLLLAMVMVATLLVPVGAVPVGVVGDATNGYFTTDGTNTQVYPIEFTAGVWTIADAVVNGISYSDGTSFFAADGDILTITLSSAAYMLPTEAVALTGAAATANDVHYDFIGATTILCTVTMGAAAVALSVDSAFAEAQAAPDGRGMSMSVDGTTQYQRDATGAFAVIQTITVTASDGAGYRIIDEMYTRSPFVVPAGQDFPFTISSTGNLGFPDPLDTALVTGCTINGTAVGDLTTLNLQVLGTEITGIIPGAELATDASITFTLDAARLVQLVGVIPVSGAGYNLVNETGALPGSTGGIVLALNLDAGYSDCMPTVSVVGGGYTVNDEGAAGSLRRMFYINFDGLATIPATDLAVVVSGVVPNVTAGGGTVSGGGAAPPPIRVENQLNQGNVSSDTILWPAGTTEQDGVSHTVVSDAELDALLKLAQQHAKDIDGLQGEGLKEGVIRIENLEPNVDNDSYLLDLTEKQMQMLANEGWDLLTISTPAGDFSMNQETLEQAAGQGGAVRMTLVRLTHAGRPGVDATLTVGSAQVTQLDSVYGVRLFIPYTPAPGEDVNALTILYIHEDGTEELVSECSYDAQLGGLIFHTSHLSKFGVSYRPAVFTDVTAKHWANPYVTFLAARGVVSGYQGGSFRPDAVATRGEALSMFTKALTAAQLPGQSVQVYSDLAIGSAVAPAAAWVYFNNLAGSITSGGKFRPGEPITREDAATLLFNIASGVGLRLRSKGLDTDYTDAAQIAAYAKTAVEQLRAASILEMAQNLKFNPKATLNRGELAQITATLLSNF